MVAVMYIHWCNPFCLCTIFFYLITVWYFLLHFITLKHNYTLYKNPGFWLVNSRCIFRVFSYLGLISFIFNAAGVFAWRFNFFSRCAGYLRKHISLCFPRVPQTAKFIRNISSLPETRKCSDAKDLTFFSLCAVVFAKTYFTFLPSRATNRQIHSE